MIHAARIDKSSRLQRLLRVLGDGQPHNTLHIQQRTGSMAVHTDIAELRANGHHIETSYVGKRPNGSRVYAYRLVVSHA